MRSRISTLTLGASLSLVARGFRASNRISKRYGVYLADHRARARLTDLESKVYVRVQRLDQINAN